MTRRAAVAALGILNVAILVATSAPHYVASDAIDLGTVILDADQPGLIVDGMVEVGEDAHGLTLSLSFDGESNLPPTGRVALYELPEGSDEPEEGAEPLKSTILVDHVGEDDSVSLLFQYGAPLRGGPFHLLLVLEGEAKLVGELTLGAMVSSTVDTKELWVELSEVEVSPVLAPVE